MSETSWWIAYAPFVTVAGPIVGALIGAGVTYLLVIKRKTVLFVKSPSEDLTLPLHQNLQRISHKIDDREVLNLNRGMIHVLMRGNTSIDNFKFEIIIRGVHDFVLSQVTSLSDQLSNGVKFDYRKIRTAKPADVIAVSLPFLNPKEGLTVSVFFDNETVDCEVDFRMPDVRADFLRVRDARGITPQVLETINTVYPFGNWLMRLLALP
jgi:hypothetical protein